MGLSKKQRLEKQRKQRLRRMAKAKVVLYKPQPVRRSWRVADVGQRCLMAAVSATAAVTWRACLAVAWLALLPFVLAGRAVSRALELAVAPFDDLGTAVAGATFWLVVEAWRGGNAGEQQWVRRMEKLEREVARLKKEVKAVKAAAAATPAPCLPKEKSAKGVTSALALALPPPPPPMAMAPPPPPPPMGLPPPPVPRAPKALVFQKPRARARQEAPSAGISLAALLNAKGGLKRGSRPLQGLPPQARNGMPAISLKDISGVQLKKTTRKGDENAPKNTLQKKSVAIQLRKTQIERSPGGTPMRPKGVRETSDSSTNIISSALRTKFKSLRVKSPLSASPTAASEADETYLSPYKPRSRLAVR